MNPTEAYIRAIQLLAAKDFEGAYRTFIEVVRADTNHAEAWIQIGLALRHSKQVPLSIVCLRKSLAARDNVTSRYELGESLRVNRELTEAQIHLKKVVAENPHLTKGWYSLALVYMMTGHIDLAIEANETAAELEPQLNEMKWIRPTLLLMKGDYARGFQDYGSLRAFERGTQKPPEPLWSGEDLRDKTIHVFNDQGYGDIIQFSRFVDRLPAKQIIFTIPRALRRLFEESFGDPRIRFLSEGDTPPSADYCTSLYSIPKYFLNGSIPAAPYLKLHKAGVVPEAEAKISKPNGTGKTIGICWSGNPQHPYDSHRSVNPEVLIEALARPGVELYSLQVAGVPASRFLVGELGLAQDLAPLIHDFADTANFVSQLDLVVTVDSAVAHLCGALGVPCCVLIGYGAVDWRWMHGRNDSPWYPSVKLHRQKEFESWAETLRRLEL